MSRQVSWVVVAEMAGLLVWEAGSLRLFGRKSFSYISGGSVRSRVTVYRVERHASIAIVGPILIVAIAFEATTALELESTGVETDAHVSLNPWPCGCLST